MSRQFTLTLGILIIGAASLYGIKRYLFIKEVKQQQILVERSLKAFDSFRNNYFKCNESSYKTLDSFSKNHELKVRRLMALEPSRYTELDVSLDSQRAKNQELVDKCSASLPKQD